MPCSQLNVCIILSNDTTYLFLFQLHSVSKNNLQLVGVTAMFIASKYEEMYPPEINDFVYITDNAYTLNQIKSTECLMLKTLDYNLGKPLCLHFLRRNSKAAGVSLDVVFRGCPRDLLDFLSLTNSI